jgi:hypothetical protein
MTPANARRESEAAPWKLRKSAGFPDESATTSVLVCC